MYAVNVESGFMHDLRGNYILSLNKPGTTIYGLSSLFSYVSAKLRNALPDFIRKYEFTGFKRECRASFLSAPSFYCFDINVELSHGFPCSSLYANLGLKVSGVQCVSNGAENSST